MGCHRIHRLEAWVHSGQDNVSTQLCGGPVLLKWTLKGHFEQAHLSGGSETDPALAQHRLNVSNAASLKQHPLQNSPMVH
ncbi:hypothetical protein GN956_G5598 [Arapaima gigas]